MYWASSNGLHILIGKITKHKIRPISPPPPPPKKKAPTLLQLHYVHIDVEVWQLMAPHHQVVLLQLPVEVERVALFRILPVGTEIPLLEALYT